MTEYINRATWKSMAKVVSMKRAAPIKTTAA